MLWAYRLFVVVMLILIYLKADKIIEINRNIDDNVANSANYTEKTIKAIVEKLNIEERY